MKDNTLAAIAAEAAEGLEAVRKLHEQGRLPAELGGLLHLAPPQGLEALVGLLHKDSQRRIRRDAGPVNWDRLTCGAWITYEPSTAPSERGGANIVAEPA